MRNVCFVFAAVLCVQLQAADAPGANPRFAEVEKLLDRDGDFYAYLNTRPFLAFVGDLAGKTIALVEKAMAKDVPEEQVAKFKEGVALARTVVDGLGLAQLGDVGMSVRATGDGLFRTRFVLGKSTPADRGLFWSVVPENGQGLPGLSLFPKHSVMASAQRLNVSAFWSGFKDLVAKTPAQPLLQQGLDQAKSSGFDVEAILASIGDELAFCLALDETRTVEFPVVGAMPEPSMLLGVKIKDRTIPTLLTLLNAGLKDNVAQTNLTPGVSATVITPPGLPPVLAPSWAEHKGWLVLASHPDALRRGVLLLDGKGDGLAANPEYLRYSKGLPTNGVSVAFVSTRIADVYATVLGNVMNAQAGNPGAPPLPEGFADGFASLFAGMRDSFGACAVGEKLPGGGMRSTTQGPFNYSISVSYMGLVFPAAMAAAVALPALTGARMSTQTFPMQEEADPDSLEEPSAIAVPVEEEPMIEPEPALAAPEVVETAPVDPAAQKKECSANLQAIHKAIQRSRFSNSRGPLFPDGNFPVCPAGGEYIMPGSNLELPKCTVPGHTFR